jgi:hypothetical protein
MPMTHTDMTDADTTPRRGRPIETPMQRASKLLSAIENADPIDRHHWDQAVVRCIDMDANDFVLGLRRLVRGQ